MRAQTITIPMELKQKWHNINQENVLKKLQSRVAGLNADEVAVRLTEYGPNVLEAKKKPSIVMMFLRQFLSPLVYVLIFAALIKFAVGGYLDGIVILSMLLLMAFIGFIQEAKAEKAMEALIQLASPKAKVKRGGDTLIVSAKNIVPGDIIILEAGDKVPADARLINASNLKVNEIKYNRNDRAELLQFVCTMYSRTLLTHLLLFLELQISARVALP